MRTRGEINSLSRRRKLVRGSGGMLSWGFFFLFKAPLIPGFLSHVQLPLQSSDKALQIGELFHY